MNKRPRLSGTGYKKQKEFREKEAKEGATAFRKYLETHNVIARTVNQPGPISGPNQQIAHSSTNDSNDHEIEMEHVIQLNDNSDNRGSRPISEDDANNLESEYDSQSSDDESELANVFNDIGLWSHPITDGFRTEIISRGSAAL